jgi:hypothetical protein
VSSLGNQSRKLSGRPKNGLKSKAKGSEPDDMSDPGSDDQLGSKDSENSASEDETETESQETISEKESEHTAPASPEKPSPSTKKLQNDMSGS